MNEVRLKSIFKKSGSSCMSVASTITNNVSGDFGDYALAAMSVSNKIMRFIQSDRSS